MPTTTIYVDTAQALGYVGQQGALANVRAGTASPFTSPILTVSWSRYTSSTSSYTNIQSFLAFDTSTLPAGAVVTSAVLYLKPSDNPNSGNETIKVYTFDAGAAFDNSDYRSQTLVQGLTEHGSFTHSTSASTTTYSISCALTGLTYGGIVRLMLDSAGFEGGTTPASTTNFDCTYNLTAGSQPYLEITYEAPPAGESWFFGSGESSMYASGITRSSVETATTATALDNPLTCNIGMDGTDLGASFYNWEGFLRFDTSSLPAGNYTGTLRLYVNTAGGPNSSAVTLRAYAYSGGSIDTTDYQTLAEVQAFSPLIGSVVVPSAASAEYIQFDISGAVTPGGTTSIILISNQFEDQLSLTGENIVQMGGHSATNAAQRPRLSVVSAGAPPGSGNPMGPGTFQAIGSGTLQVRKNGQWVQL